MYSLPVDDGDRIPQESYGRYGDRFKSEVSLSQMLNIYTAILFACNEG